MEARGDTTTRAARALPVAGLVILLLVAVGTFLPRPADPDLLFGLDRYRDLGAAWFVVAAVALLALLLGPGLANGIANLCARLGAVPPAAGAALTVAGAGALFWLLPNYRLSGDAGTVMMLAAAGKVYPSNTLTSWLFSGGAVLGLDPVTAIRLVSTLAGMVYAAAAVGLARECFEPGARRVGLAAVLLTTGTVALFFGTIEVYAPLVAAVAVFLLFGVRYLHGKGRGIAPALTLGIAFCLHGSAGLLLPALLVLAGRGRLKPLPLRRGLVFGLVFLVPVAATFLGLWFGTWEGEPPPPGPLRTGTFFGPGDEGPLLPLVLTPHEPTQRYALLDPEHLAGVANVFLLVAPVGLALLVIGRQRFREPVPAFVGIAALFLVLFPVFWNVSYDLRRDWDLFSMVGVPVALLGGLVYLSVRGGGGDSVRLAALGVFCLAPFVAGNHGLDRQRLRYAAEMQFFIGEALPMVASREAAGAAMRAAAERGVPAPRVSRAEWRTALEHFARTLLAPVPPQLADVRARLDRDLASAMQSVVDEHRAQDRAIPPIPVVAFQAVRAVAGEGDPARELALLDALDEALEAAGAYDPAEWRVATHPVATGIANADRRWGGLVADALREALAGERMWRLVETRDRWLARRRALEPPGLREAVQRAEWLWNAGDAETAERLARHGLERAPGETRWLDLLGGILLAHGRRAEGREVLRQLIRAEPQQLGVRLRLSNDLITHGEQDEALALMSRGLRISGYGRAAPAALFQLGWLRLERGEPDVAASVLRTALRHLDQVPPTPYNDALRTRARKLLLRAERLSRG